MRRKLARVKDFEFQPAPLEEILAQRLANQLQASRIEGEQWFREFHYWIRVVFNNPLNWKHPNSELAVLYRHSAEIAPYVLNRLQVHYGVGVGETELEVIRWQVEHGQGFQFTTGDSGVYGTEVVAIDACAEFLQLFRDNLRDRSDEYEREILVDLRHTTFQESGVVNAWQYECHWHRAIHICLGSTIGNFAESQEIWSVFQKNAHRQDRLLLGFQLDTHIQPTFEKYRRNRYYSSFVLQHLLRRGEEIKPELVRWELDEESGFIRMHYDGIEAFRSRKHTLQGIVNDAEQHGFEFLESWQDEYNNTCVAVFEKK